MIINNIDIYTAAVDLNGPEPVHYSFQEIEQKINGIARAVAKFNFPKSSRVAIIGLNSIRYLAVFHGLQKAGLVAVPVNYKLSTEQIAFILKDSDSMLVFADTDMKNKCPTDIPVIDLNTVFEEFADYGAFSAVDLADHDPIFFMYTSGSTGVPKAAVISKESRRWLISTIAKKYLKTPTPGRRTLVSAPFYHMNGLTTVETCLVGGTVVVILPTFSTKAYSDAITKYKITSLTVIPPMMAMLLNDQDVMSNTDFSSVAKITLGSAPTSKKLFEEIKAAFPKARVTITYGLTEVGPNLFDKHPRGIKKPIGSVGWPRPDIEYKLIDGVLHIKSPSMLSAYHKRDEAYNSSVTQDGFFNTKDVFEIDEKGFYYFVRRADDMFVSGGENIFPTEVEQAIDKHPAVLSSAVIGLEDNIKGTKPYAFVVLKPNYTVSETELKEFLFDTCPSYQVPRNIWFLEEMILTGSNKIDKNALIAHAKTLV